MRLAKLRGPLACAILLAALPAAAGEPSYQAVESLLKTSETNQGQAIVYPSTGPAEVTAVIVTLMPGDSTARHHHEVPLFAYLLEGELTVAYEGRGEKRYKAGDALIEARDIRHVGTNSGEDPVRILAVFMGADGARNTVAAE
jgi:quercetin dioxygenase-like cupin family protein